MLDGMNATLISFEVLTFALLLSFGTLTFFLVSRIRVGRNSSAEGDQHGSEDVTSAKEILDERYARGEITQEEYLTIRDDITRTQNA